MLGQPLSLLLPAVVGIELRGALPEGSTATDLVLTVAQLLRKHGVVGKFVEFYGEGVGRVPVENRATIGNMSPEYGSTCTIFPVDDETLRYLRATGRPDDLVALVEAYAKEQGLWHDPSARPVYDETLVLDLSTVEPSIAGPARPQDRVSLTGARDEFEKALLAFRRSTGDADPDVPFGVKPGSADDASAESFPASDPPAASEGMTNVGEPDGEDAPGTNERPVSVGLRSCPVTLADGIETEIADGHVVIAAITSCTNTSNPSVMIGAGPAREEGGRARAHRPAVGEDLARARVARRHRLLRTLGPDRAARETRLPGRRLRMHHVHRQLRSVATRDLAGHHRRRPVGVFGPVGQPQLRGPHPPRLSHELPRVAPARRRVRTCRNDGPRLARGTTRRRHRRHAGVPPRHLADLGGSGRDRRLGHRDLDVHEPLRAGLRRRRALARPPRADGRALHVGRHLDLHPQAAVLRRRRAGSGSADRHRRGARPRAAGRQRDDGPHLAGRRDPP